MEMARFEFEITQQEADFILRIAKIMGVSSPTVVRQAIITYQLVTEAGWSLEEPKGATKEKTYAVQAACKNCKQTLDLHIPWGVSVKADLAKAELPPCPHCGVGAGVKWDGD